MNWFKHNDKLYLLLDAERSRQHCYRRPSQTPRNPRSGEHVVRWSTFAPTPHEDPMGVQLPSQYGSYFFCAKPIFFYTSTTTHTIIHFINTLSRSNFCTTSIHKTILHVDAASNTDVSGIVDNFHILSAIKLCDLIHLLTTFGRANVQSVIMASVSIRVRL